MAVEIVGMTDRAECVMQDKTLKVDVLSASGIGRIELRVKKEGAEWPESIVISLRYADGKPLKELEGLSISGKKIRIDGSRRTSGHMDCHELNPGDQKPGEKPPRKVGVSVEKTADAMQVTIPGKLLAGESGIKIQWVDFYRG